MDRLDHYREAVRRVLREYAGFGRPPAGVRTEYVEDPARDHYAVFHTGWDRRQRVHAVVLHVDIVGGKVWIEHNGTEVAVAEELVAAGVPKADIVLGYKSPALRAAGEYAVG